MTPDEWAEKHLVVGYIGPKVWKSNPKKPASPAIEAMVSDLVAASERFKRIRRVSA